MIMAYDYFLWNFPLFISNACIEAKLCLIFGKCSVDIFAPRKERHQTHAGMVRVKCNQYHDFGDKTELDLGFRYPVFAKHSKRSQARKSNIWKSRHNVDCDLTSDENSSESSCSISMCSSINITRPVITIGDSIDILPASQASNLLCQSAPAIDLLPASEKPVLVKDYDLTTLTVLPVLTCSLETSTDLTTTCIEMNYDYHRATLETENQDPENVSADSTIEDKFHDFEQLKTFIKDLQYDCSPHMTPADGLIPAQCVKQRIRNTFRCCRSYI